MFDPELDLSIERFMRATPEKVWQAWTTPMLLEQWWVPHPSRCRVIELELRAGGAFRTEYSDGEGPFAPHLDACFLLVEPGRRLIFSDALTAGFRPAEKPFITADFHFEPAPGGTTYRAHVMHKSPDDRDRHVELGFFDGWTTVTEQLAALVETAAN
ncbi:MAG TPA: SRPBCC family protein [Devosia sp.]